MLYETAGDIEAAVSRYRRVIELQPQNAFALNNLAMHIAADTHAAAEALPFARRAAAVAPQDPRVLDTLGWISHLVGNRAEAVTLLVEAARLAPRHVETRLHAAIALAAAGAYAGSEHHLNAALRLSPDVQRREDVKQLRETLAKRH